MFSNKFMLPAAIILILLHTWDHKVGSVHNVPFLQGSLCRTDWDTDTGSTASIRLVDTYNCNTLKQKY